MGSVGTPFNQPIADWDAWRALLARLAMVVARLGGEAWVVGGCLRDVVSMATSPRAPAAKPQPNVPVVWRDVDVAVTGEPLTLARTLADDMRADYADAQGIGIAPLREKTVRLHIGPPILPFRAQLDLSRLDGGAIEADLAQRDFTINALALPLTAMLPTQSASQPLDPQGAGTGADDANSTDTSVTPPSTQTTAGNAPSRLTDATHGLLVPFTYLIDPFGGVNDLLLRRLAVVSPHALTDDPGRILRGARLLTQAALAPTEETTRLVRAAAPLLLTLPADRVRDELRAILAQPRAQEPLEFLAAVGAFQTLFPTLWAELAADAGDDLTSGGGWWLALAALRRLASPVSLLGEGAISEPQRLATDDVSLLDAWYASPLADGAPRSLALRWGALLSAATMWRAFAASQGAEPAGALPPDAPVASGQSLTGFDAPIAARLAELARTLPITREERRLAETIALATPQAMRLLTLEIAQEDGALPDAIETRRYFAAYDMAGIDALAAALAMARAYAQRFDELGPSVGSVTLDAPTLARMAHRARRLGATYLATPERIVPAPLLDGAAVIRELGVAPGPLVGATLAAIRTAQIERRVASRAEALAWGAAYVRQQGAQAGDGSQAHDAGQ